VRLSMMITASLVKELREHTGAGMMECKKALEEAKGNLETAITIMRKSGQAKAAKKVDRVAAEGVILIKISSDNKRAVMVEINCETDFAARDRYFLEFASVVAQKALDAQIAELDKLLIATLDSGQTIIEMREALVAKIGENISIRRVKALNVSGDGSINSYIHGNGRIGVLVGLSVVNSELGKDIAMHVAACKPIALMPEEFPADLLVKEKEIYLAQLRDSGKPPEILEKIVAGRIQKLVSESVLIKQPFVKDPDITVENLLQKFNARVLGFARFEVGEGIEKKETDFATEVEAQVESRSLFINSTNLVEKH